MSESLVSIRQTGECESSNHDLFKFPLKPIQRWRRFMSTPPTPTDGGGHEGKWCKWDLVKQRLQPDTLQSKHENTHMRNTQRKFSLDIRHLRKNKNIPHTHTHRWGTITKPSFPFQFAKNHACPIGGRLGDEGFLSKCCNIKSGLFSPQWPYYPLTLGTCWTYTHTHRHHRHPHPYLFWALTPPPRDDNATQPFRAAQARERARH